jgi:hypothetical protein
MRLDFIGARGSKRLFVVVASVSDPRWCPVDLIESSEAALIPRVLIAGDKEERF